MSTTTIRIDEALKARLAAVAERAGKTSHAFIVEAIAETVARAEHAAEFHAMADERWAALVASGESLPWEALRERMAGRMQSLSGLKVHEPPGPLDKPRRAAKPKPR
jgi:predicted transcriptional regulator